MKRHVLWSLFQILSGGNRLYLLQLLGFYILSETLSMKGAYRYGYKQHEELIPLVADYCHSLNEGLYWIPYSVSADDADHNRALQNWKKFGLDLAVLQPNYYWQDKSWTTTCTWQLPL